MRVLVTGGAGFIGSHIVDLLVDRGDDVLSVDNISPAAHVRAPTYLNPGAEHRTLTLDDIDGLTSACRGVDAVCHQAARVGLGVNFDDVTDYVADNCAGTANLFKSLYRNGFAGRVVQASSMVVYGEGRYRCPEHGEVAPGRRRAQDLLSSRFEPPCPVCGRTITPTTVNESAPLDPRTVYAATKAHQEHLGTAFAGATGSDVVSLRYHNVYGPRMPRDTPYAGVASIFRSSCEAHRPPQVFEDGQQRRDFIHVTDVATANILALTAPGTIGRAYNIATGQVCTISELAEYVCDGVDPTAPRPVITGRYRAGDVRHINASPALAQQTFGFNARVNHQDGLTVFATAPLRESLQEGRSATG